MRLLEHPFLRYVFAGIWLVNGLFCKVLGQVPRHQEIVAAILAPEHAGELTVAIGWAEIGMAVWIVTGWRYRLCALVQIMVILTMNIIEFAMVPHLLLWGRINIVLASMFCAVIHVNAFGLRVPSTR